LFAVRCPVRRIGGKFSAAGEGCRSAPSAASSGSGLLPAAAVFALLLSISEEIIIFVG